MQTIVQPAAPATPPSSAMPDGFVKVDGGASEQVTETASLMVAYSAIWLILMAFTLVSFRALQQLRGQAQRAERAVGQLPNTAR